MLKAELHAHSGEDPKDAKWIRFSARQLVDRAIKMEYDVLAITLHNKVYEDPELKKYATSKGLLLIYGIERDVEGKHVLMYGVTNEEALSISTFKQLRELRKRKKIFTIAAHPPYPAPSCLGKNIYKHFDLFDAWEHSFLHTKYYNPNRKMMRDARRLGKPVVGNSDVHIITDLGRAYSLIDAKKTEQDVFQAILDGKVKVRSRHLPTKELIRIIILGWLSAFRTIFKNNIRQKI